MNECLSQNDLLLSKLMIFYNKNDNLDKMLCIINGESKISLRIVDWFSTNYAKKFFTVYPTKNTTRFKVYEDYKLRLKAYSKKRFDPFCRWDRIKIPYKEEGTFIETTIGQLNFFKWALENNIINYIEEHYQEIENDMNNNNSISKTKKNMTVKNIDPAQANSTKTRKRREELSVSAIKTMKKEKVEIIVSFD